MSSAALHASTLPAIAKPQLDFLPTGIPSIDAAFHGIPRGAITELSGPRSCGKTSICLSALAQATTRGETCAYIDPGSRFDPASASRSGIVLRNLLWTQCHGDAGAAMKVADLLLHGGGMGVVCLDLVDLPPRILNRIPMSYWYRFRRAIESTQTILLVIAEEPVVRSCALRSMACNLEGIVWSGVDNVPLLDGLQGSAMQRRPAHSSIAFSARAI